MADTRETVLIVEDEPAVVEALEMMLEDGYEVLSAEDGAEALAVVDESVDVVLLDRMLPGTSGDEVLAEIRDRGIGCQVVMVTAVDPDFDIVGMGFDDYVTKPPTESELRGTIEDVLARADYEGRVREYHSLLAKRSVLVTDKTEAELADSREFAELEERIEATERRLDEDDDRLLEDTEFVGALRDLGEDDTSEEVQR